jgi:hypothetical protein
VDGGLGRGVVFCFQAILCWSRWRLWWFTTGEDRKHTFEGLVRFFEAAGGVPRIARTDRILGRWRPGARLLSRRNRTDRHGQQCRYSPGRPQGGHDKDAPQMLLNTA